MIIFVLLLHFIISVVVVLSVFLVTVVGSDYFTGRKRTGSVSSSGGTAEDCAREGLPAARRNPRFPNRPSLDDILAGTAPNQHVEPLFSSHSVPGNSRRRTKASSCQIQDVPSSVRDVPSQTSVSSSADSEAISRTSSSAPVPSSSAAPLQHGETPQHTSSPDNPSEVLSEGSSVPSDPRVLSFNPFDTPDLMAEGAAFWVSRSEFTPKKELDATDRMVLADDVLWDSGLNESWMYKRSSDQTYWLAIKFSGLNLKHKQVTKDEFERHHADPALDRVFLYSYYSEEILEILSGPSQIAYSYVLDDRWKMNVFNPLPFNNVGHLKAHVNYLLRIDRVNKYVTDLTPQCNMAFFGKTDKVYPMGTHKNRKLTGNILFRDLMQGAGKSVAHLRMQLVEIKVDEEKEDLSDTDRLRLFTDYIARRERIADGWKVMAYIEHSDYSHGRVYHIHTLLRQFKEG